MDRPNDERNGEIAAISLLLSEFYDGAQLFSSEVFDTTSEVFDKDISKDQRDNIFYRHFDFRPRRITKEEYMKSALEPNMELVNGEIGMAPLLGYQDSRQTIILRSLLIEM